MYAGYKWHVSGSLQRDMPDDPEVYRGQKSWALYGHILSFIGVYPEILRGWSGRYHENVRG